MLVTQEGRISATMVIRIRASNPFLVPTRSFIRIIMPPITSRVWFLEELFVVLIIVLGMIYPDFQTSWGILSVCLRHCPEISIWSSNEGVARSKVRWRRKIWWRHQMETFSVLPDFCAGNSLVTGKFPAQRPVTRSFDVFFDLHLNKRMRKQWWGW